MRSAASLTFAVGQAPRRRARADVHQTLDAMPLQQRDELIEPLRRVLDSVDRSHKRSYALNTT